MGMLKPDYLENLPSEFVAELVSDVAIAPTFLIYENLQILAYYNIDRLLSIAIRDLSTLKWNYWTTDSFVKWDSHNYIDLGVDKAGIIHIAGNMHASPLEYFLLDTKLKNSKPLKIDLLVDEDSERKITYPRFTRNNNGNLLFLYRDGFSGDGDFIAVAWDEELKKHHLVSKEPIISGQGKRNAYIDSNAPIMGPDGNWHLLWVWRDTPHAETTNTVNYAYSDDLVTWKSATSVLIDAPIIKNMTFVVDPVPSRKGLINNNVKLGFLNNGKPIIFYHKNNNFGVQQLWRAMHINGEWDLACVSHWNIIWSFHGQGSLDFQIEIDKPHTTDTGVSVDVRTKEQVETYNFNGQGELLSVAPASSWSPIIRTVREDGLIGRRLKATSWANDLSNESWFATYATVQDQRDQKPLSGVRSSFPLNIVKVEAWNMI